MRLISLLLALLLVAFLVVKQLNSSSSQSQVKQVLGSDGVDIPKVPSSPKDLQNFEGDMDKFIQDNADKRSEHLEKAMGK